MAAKTAEDRQRFARMGANAVNAKLSPEERVARARANVKIRWVKTRLRAKLTMLQARISDMLEELAS